MKNIKYVPKLIAIFSYMVLLIGAIILFFGRTKTFLRIETLQNFFPDFYQHISNFSISFLLLAGVGFMWLLLGLSFKYVAWLALFIAISNIVYEVWIPVLNTPDTVDAYYGLCGTVLAFLFLVITKSIGLKPNSMIATGATTGQ